MADTPHIARTLVALGAILALTACGGSGDTDDYTVTVTQSGSTITVTAPLGVFTGTVSGNVISWAGQYEEPGEGWVTITSMSLTVNGDQLSGPVTWDFRETLNGPVVCSGSTQVTGVRIP